MYKGNNRNIKDTITDDIRELVFVDQKIVTFSYIARQYDLDIAKAKEALEGIVQELKEEGRTDFIISYYITGYEKGSNPKSKTDEGFLRYNVMEADFDELNEHKKKFFSIVDCVSLRSIRSSEISANKKYDKDLYAKAKVSDKPAGTSSNKEPLNDKGAETPPKRPKKGLITDFFK